MCTHADIDVVSLVQAADGGLEGGEIGPLGWVLHPAALHHLDDFFVAQVVVDRRPERRLLAVLHIADDFCSIHSGSISSIICFSFNYV